MNILFGNIRPAFMFWYGDILVYYKRMPKNIILDEDKEPPLESLQKLYAQRSNVFKRFPFVFALLGTFGFVSTLYGFNHLIVKIPLIANNPYIALVVGLVILLFTGTLYKKLG